MVDKEKPAVSAVDAFKKRKAAGAASKVAVVKVEAKPPVTPEGLSEPIGEHVEPKVAQEKPSRKREILVVPNKVLRTKCAEVKKVDNDILDLAHEMEDYLRNPPDIPIKPIGLAAPQFGMSVRVFSCMLNPMAKESSDRDIVTIINPRLVYEKKIHLVDETCLSLLNQVFKVKRGKIVKIKGITPDGLPRVFKGHDIVAQMFMHELNHLDGLLIDEVSKR